MQLTPRVKAALKIGAGVGVGFGVLWLLNRFFAQYEVGQQQAALLPPTDGTTDATTNADGSTSGGTTVNFDTAIDPLVRPYAQLMRAAGDQFGVSPWLLAGIMMRESNGGAALSPPGPGGVGDKTPRYRYGDPRNGFDSQGKPKLANLYAKYGASVHGSPPQSQWDASDTGFPPGLDGWGLGLMQIDYGAHNEYMGHDQTDPQTNINDGADILSKALIYFARVPLPTPVSVESWRGWDKKYGASGLYPDPRPLTGDLLIRAALAAYNAGPSGVLQAVAAGIDPDAPTTGNNYSSWVMQHIQQWSGSSSVPTTA